LGHESSTAVQQIFCAFFKPSAEFSCNGDSAVNQSENSCSQLRVRRRRLTSPSRDGAAVVRKVVDYLHYSWHLPAVKKTVGNKKQQHSDISVLNLLII
jgi:hypothetical protein